MLCSTEIRLTLIYQEEKKIYQEEFTTHAYSFGLKLKQNHATNAFAKVFREPADKYCVIKQVTCVMEVSGCAPVLALRHVLKFSILIFSINDCFYPLLEIPFFFFKLFCKFLPYK